MPNYFTAPKNLWERSQKSFYQLRVGGTWAASLPTFARQNLSWFWFDGMFAAACDNIVVNYLTLYILALGATGAQIGLMSSLSNLTAAIILLPGAMLVERIGRRKTITVASGGVTGRGILLLLALVPLVTKYPAVVLLAIGLSVLKDTAANLSFPAWMSITGDIVPMEGRGRYFASRNLAMGAAGMLTTLLAGILISDTAQISGYQIALVVASVLGFSSVFSFSRLQVASHAPVPQQTASISPAVLWKSIASQPGFLVLVASAALWNFALNIAGPFFSVYLVKNLQASAAMVGITSIATSFSTLVFQRKLGELADRWGARRMQLISGLLIPVLPLLWIFTTAAWNVIFINILSGILWGAYSLASFNYLLELTPVEQRARFSALYQIIVTVALAAGAAVGSLIVTGWGYYAVFLISGIGRLAAAILFAVYTKPAKQLIEPARA